MPCPTVPSPIVHWAPPWPQHRRDARRMTSEPLVSVVLPVGNREEWVARAIASVLAESCYPRVELIVVDDGSTDGTCRVAQSFGRSLTLLRQRHRGPYAARNLGVRHAAGKLI